MREYYHAEDLITGCDRVCLTDKNGDTKWFDEGRLKEINGDKIIEKENKSNRKGGIANPSKLSVR